MYTSLNLIGANRQECKLFQRGTADSIISNYLVKYALIQDFSIISTSSSNGNAIIGDFVETKFINLWMKDIRKHAIKLGISYDNILNFIDSCNIVTLGASPYASIYIARGYDSWILNNNIGSAYANLWLEGGPFRVLGNHLDGNVGVDQPQNNIISAGGITSTIISNNIIENSRQDSILLNRGNNTSAGFAYNNISITNNLIRSENLEGTDNTYAMIKVTASVTGQPFKNLLISNNIFEHRVKSTPYKKYKNVLYLSEVADIVFSSNLIGLDYTISNTIYKTNVTNLQVFGNSHQNYANFLFDRFELNGTFISVADTIRLTQDRTIADSSSSGDQGEICYDQNYLYIETPEGWKRIPIPQEEWHPN
ncbi:MAG: hypothetical protein J0M18_15850 [Ignavibacteria bacterium]|nr:hypothetical protein [Ignavibacteria bacterium]